MAVYERSYKPYEGEVTPDPRATATYDNYYHFYKSLYPALKDRFAAAGALA